VLLCRKMLMNVAVHEGAAEGLKFIEYVTYLSDHGYVPPFHRMENIGWITSGRKATRRLTRLH
jgi:hypothetical protein